MKASWITLSAEQLRDVQPSEMPQGQIILCVSSGHGFESKHVYARGSKSWMDLGEWEDEAEFMAALKQFTLEQG